MKTCTRCGVEKQISEYYGNSRGGIRSICKKCHAGDSNNWKLNNKEKLAKMQQKYGKKYREENSEKVKKNKSIWQSNNKEKHNIATKKYRFQDPDKQRDYKLKSHYGISLEEYNEMLKKQDGKCAICGGFSNKYSLSVDHNHASGTVRELLCRKCNAAIGLLHEDITIIEKVIRYLKKHEIIS